VTGRRAATAAAALAGCLALSGCVGPSRTDADYESKARNTAEAVASALNTVHVTAQAVRDGKVSVNYATRLVAEAEEDADAASTAFDAVQPPSDQADRVHDEVDGMVQEALDLLRVARLAVRRGHADVLVRIDQRVTEVADRLDRFEEHGP
jgi:hypothetical protein